ncbi:hypothetical protein [Burkholderia metallica]|uniref:hypothetical protein n=1 Tax=Burkholderia metallica TaxID=488729 RepID=UPI00158E6009|nr:hypothetical protein [Burkholderia metallica]
MSAVYSVSDVETGRSAGTIMEPTIDAARAIAIEKIDRATTEQWASFFPTPRRPTSRARAAAA